MEDFKINQYNFKLDEIKTKMVQDHIDYLSWPLVYLLKNKDSKKAYVGETTDIANRLKTHLKSPAKILLSSVDIITSRFFNKSATIDLESNLIKYMSADGQYILQNGNLGIANHHYYQKKETYWKLFKGIWDELNKLGITKHSLSYIDNSDLFKYSPYKSLSKEQIEGLKVILNCLLDPCAKVSLINGGAGTGKTIMAIFLFKLLNTDFADFNHSDFDEEDSKLFILLKKVKAKYKKIDMALVIPMASFRKTISKVFKNVKGLSGNMVVGPSDIIKKKYDILIVDEGHRLRRRVNLGSYYGTFDNNCLKLGLNKSNASELDWITIQSEKSIIFYDQYQSVKPSDILKEKFLELKERKDVRVEHLKSQLRVLGGNEYVKFINDIFDGNTVLNKYAAVQYEFLIFDDLKEMIHEIKKKEEEFRLSRVVAGYAWEWISKKNKDEYDIVIAESKLRWNSVTSDWINSKNSLEEVGCIHTVQGYDLNFTGVIIGPEFDYDFNKKKFVVYKDKYKDKNGKNSIKDETFLLEYIVNIYRTILLRGIRGTYLYICNDNLRKFFSHYVKNYNEVKNVMERKIVDFRTETSIPLYDFEISAGSFSELQELENIKYIDVQDNLDPNEYFACKIVGESMNKVIKNGSICLFKKYSGGSRNGLITLVENRNVFDESGSRFTVKQYLSKKSSDEDGWYHEEITLLPKSFDSEIKPIILREEETVDLKVIGVFIKVIS